MNAEKSLLASAISRISAINRRAQAYVNARDPFREPLSVLRHRVLAYFSEIDSRMTADSTCCGK